MSPDSSAAMASDEWWQLALGDADWDGKEWGMARKVGVIATLNI